MAASESMAGTSSQVLSSDLTMGDEVVISAAQQVLLFCGKAMHYTEMIDMMKDRNLVGPGIENALPQALQKECQKSRPRIKELTDRAGYFILVAKQARVKKKKVVQHVKRLSATPMSAEALQEKYKEKYKKLRKSVKDWVFLNAAVCDEVATVEEKVAKVKEERRFLMKRLLSIQGDIDLLGSASASVSMVTGGGGSQSQQNLAAAQAAAATAQATAALSTGLSSPGGSVSAIQGGGCIKPTVTLHPFPLNTKGKKEQTRKYVRKNAGETKTGRAGPTKKFICPILLDNSGRPVFPIDLEHLVVYSIGDILPDRMSFHSETAIYPVGYCSTRLFASLTKVDQHCLYTCYIQDIGNNPKFEISPEDNPNTTFKSNNIHQCHRLLMEAINRSRGVKLLDPSLVNGEEFFGLLHPSIQNLIQSCPGARKCTDYQWTKFAIAKAEKDVYKMDEDNPAIYYNSFVNLPENQYVLERYKAVQANKAKNQQSLAIKAMMPPQV